MSRHSKNNTAHSIFTYHERRMMKDAGKLKERLGGESMRRFEACWLCLRTAVSPVCTPSGIIFCRKCIIINLADQKMRMKKEMSEYEVFLKKKEDDEKRKKLEDEAKNIKSFMEAEYSAALKKDNKSTIASQNIKGKTIMDLDKADARSKNFWIVDNTPTADVENVKKPRKHMVCPITNTPLKLKELIDIQPETTKDDSETALWLCSISKKPISHQKAAVIKSTGQVMLLDCVEKFVIGNKGYYDKEITKNDIIPLLPGGTGYSYHNKVEAEKYRPVME